MNNYKPMPVCTDDVKLSEDMLELTEVLAKNVHEIWAKSRIEEGWVYGSERNADKMTTPCLVPYEELPETEKEYDRNTAMETLKLLVSLGYTITKQ